MAVWSRGPVVLIVLALAGCSSVPDAVNPVEWYRSASGALSSRSPSQPSASDAKMAEAQSQSTPNLATVPPRPTRASTPSERQALTQGLVADRENAKYTDDDLQPRAGAPASSAGIRPAAPPPAATAAPTPPPAPPAPAAPTQAGTVLQPTAPQSASPPPAPAAAPPPVAPRPPAAAAPAAPASTASSESVQPVPPPPPPTMPQVSSTAPRTANRPPGAAASPAPVPASPPPAPAAPRAAAPAPSAAPVPATVAEIYNRQLPGTAAPQAAPAPRPATAVPAQAPAASVDQVYRQQLARSEAVVQLRQPVAEPPPPLPAQPRRIGALQHTARETGRSQVAYVGGSTGVAPMAIRPGEPVSVIRFGEGSARLGTADRETVARIAAMANEVRGMVRIVGHAGRPGGGEGPKQEVAEFGLSLDRANAVAQELMRNGISADRLKVEAVGDAEPLVIAGSAAAEAANRRAEIFIE